MKTLQEAFDSQIQEYLSLHKVGTKLIKRRFDNLGIHLTEDQLIEIESKLQNFESDAITVDMDENQILSFDLNLEDNFRIDLSDSDDEVEEIVNQFVQGLSGELPEIITQSSKPLLKRLKRKAPSMLKDHKRVRKSFESRLAKLWRKSLDLLEMFFVIAFEAGEELNNEFRATTSEEPNYVLEVLTRLHARACQITSEILVLLRSGHADGAHARWRSLHEIAVIGFFIKSAGNEIAEKYLLHDAIESYKAAKLYQEHCTALGYDPLSEEEFNEIESTYQNLINRFGLSYKGDYGWAVPLIGKERPTFKDIEEKVELNHLRPFYKMASHNVHANPKGVFFKLGLYPKSQDILLAGPSNAGLADPGHGTAISLGQITITLLTIKPTIDTLVICNILTQLEQEIGEAFLATQKSLEDNEAA
jgi:hypothetical protein